MAKGTGRGGKRAGAGKPMSAKNRIANDVLKRAESSGELPADILLRIARDAANEYDMACARLDVAWGLAEHDLSTCKPDIRELVENSKKDVAATRKEARASAEAAAPFFNPRLANVDFNASGDLVVEMVRFSDEKPAKGKKA